MVNRRYNRYLGDMTMPLDSHRKSRASVDSWTVPAALLLVSSLVFAADPAAAQVRLTQTTRGDTTVMRTTGSEPAASTRKLERVLSIGRLDGPAEYVFGSSPVPRLDPDGRLWIWDRTVPALRRYDSTGRYLRSVGRGGAGPGEYSSLVGLAFPGRGTAAVKNPDKGILMIFDSTGRHLGDWRVPADSISRGQPPAVRITSHGIVADTAGRIYAQTSVGTRPVPGGPSRHIAGMVRFARDGSVDDSIAPPDLGLVDELRALPNAGAAPFAPVELWNFSKLGYFVGGRSDRYAIHIVRGNRNVIRIERDLPRVRLSAEERAALGTRYNAAAIPRDKPYFSNIITDEDGRIWVSLYGPAERVPSSPGAAATAGDAGRGGAAAIPVFRQENLFEVFSRDGRYLGRVQLPEFIYPSAIKGEFVWNSSTDANGVPLVVKYRITPPLGPG